MCLPPLLSGSQLWDFGSVGFSVFVQRIPFRMEEEKAFVKAECPGLEGGVSCLSFLPLPTPP